MTDELEDLEEKTDRLTLTSSPGNFSYASIAS